MAFDLNTRQYQMLRYTWMITNNITQTCNIYLNVYHTTLNNIKLHSDKLYYYTICHLFDIIQMEFINQYFRLPDYFFCSVTVAIGNIDLYIHNFLKNSV
jgi:hypothetical protein